jgi:MFS family permease
MSQPSGLTLEASSFSQPLSARAAFYLEASLIVSFLAGSSAPTPLYGVYQSAWGFSPIVITIVFGVYALAVLASLLTFGSLSDHVGRRPVLLVASVLQAITMLVFASADGLGALIAARVLQGLATGAAVSAIGAGMLDIDRVKGTVANSVGPMLGTGAGGILSGLLVQYLPAPTQLVYLVLFAVFVVQAAAVTRMPETAALTPGALASLKPHFRLPRTVREPLVAATPAIVAAWALAGFYASLGPTLVRQMLGSSSRLIGGLALFVLAASGSAVVLLLRKHPPLTLLATGSALLLTGVGLTLVAVGQSSAGLFFLGTSISGMGFGAGFQGAIRTVMARVEASERAGVLSVLYVISYASMGLPAVLAGFRVVHAGGVLHAAHEYGLVVMLLSALALLGCLRALSLGRATNARPSQVPAVVTSVAARAWKTDASGERAWHSRGR